MNGKSDNPSRPQDNTDSGIDDIKLVDPVALAHALADVYKRTQPLIEEFLSRQRHDLETWNPDPMNVGNAWAEYMGSLLSDPEKFWSMQKDYWQKWMDVWQESGRKFLGEDSKDIIAPKKGDRRFADSEWQDNAIFGFLKQSYLLTCEWLEKSVGNADGIGEEKRKKLAFSARLFADALSPTNFLMTNPQVLKETIKSGGENLVKGLENLTRDLERGHGTLKISTTDYKAFEPGRNIAITPGKVVFQNDLMQLIQYAPSTQDVFERPLLIVPPWINKYYILDLRPENSFIRWAVDQGHTVFVVSWVNPGPDLAHKTFEDYMKEGILAPLGHIEDATKVPDCNVIGYCLGGTLLSIALAYLASKNLGAKIASATFLTTLIDFRDSGDLKLFLDDEQLALLDREMADAGILQARKLQQTFNLLRANDLIWSFVINNYLLGRDSFPFDLLYWNDDSTNMPAAMHSFYLRKMYGENALVEPGGISMDGAPIDIRKIKTPAYFLSTREDHIAPWKATYRGTQILSGPVTFTLAASGHIAGVVNAPERKKYCHWTSDKTPPDPEDWLASARQEDGSWWPHWQRWIENYAGPKISVRPVENGIENAPGSYVRVRSE